MYDELERSGAQVHSLESKRRARDGYGYQRAPCRQLIVTAIFRLLFDSLLCVCCLRGVCGVRGVSLGLSD